MNFLKLAKHCFCLLPSMIVISCANDNKGGTWKIYLENVGTYSSPRVVDLNKDGVLDIVMGAGGKEDRYSDTAVIALNGTNGELLWRVPGYNQFVGSPIFKDINQDGTDDIFIGGRWAELAAINGANGERLWSFYAERTTPNPADSGWYNFSTPQFIPDQDKDGLEDLLISNGGNPRAAPHDPKRPAGRLLVLSSRSGKILSNVQVPDGKETYMSVVCFKKKDGELAVLFGTGGETIGGHLYRTTLTNIMKGDISEATVLATSNQKGFVAPPVLVDITGDGIDEIVVNAVDGRMLAINGFDDSLSWQVNFAGTEAYTTPAIGYFNGDSVPDFFSNYAIGTFPNLTRSIRFMVDGKTGKVAYLDTIRAFQYASPVVADLNGDGFDDALVNQSELKGKQFEYTYYSYLLFFDFKNNKKYPLGDTLPATNLASTPWIGDLDNDNKLDIVYSAVKYHDIKIDLQTPLGLYVSRYPTGIEMKKALTWGAYMGSDYTGIFRTSPAAPR